MFDRYKKIYDIGYCNFSNLFYKTFTQVSKKYLYDISVFKFLNLFYSIIGISSGKICDAKCALKFNLNGFLGPSETR